jgi:hypothetical protein
MGSMPKIPCRNPGAALRMPASLEDPVKAKVLLGEGERGRTNARDCIHSSSALMYRQFTA